MSRIWILLIASVLVSTVISAPNSRDDGQKVGVHSSEQEISDNQLQLESPKDVGTRTIKPAEGARTLIMFGLLRWIFGVVKAMIKPARDMYITMMPEISAFRCLSDSREFQDFMGFSGTDFEGYVYETPRSSNMLHTNYSPSEDYRFEEQGTPSDEYHPQYQQEHQTDTLHHKYASYAPDNQRQNFAYDAPPENYVSQTTQHRTDEVLKRIPRFIDEFASLLKEGQAMQCIMPYMRERVTRWIDG